MDIRPSGCLLDHYPEMRFYVISNITGRMVHCTASELVMRIGSRILGLLDRFLYIENGVNIFLRCISSSCVHPAFAHYDWV